MVELLSPAGGWESMVAAVQNGADAVYMGFGGLNARRSARNFTDEEFARGRGLLPSAGGEGVSDPEHPGDGPGAACRRRGR